MSEGKGKGRVWQLWCPASVLRSASGWKWVKIFNPTRPDATRIWAQPTTDSDSVQNCFYITARRFFLSFFLILSITDADDQSDAAPAAAGSRRGQFTTVVSRKKRARTSPPQPTLNAGSTTEAQRRTSAVLGKSRSSNDKLTATEMDS